MDKDSSTSCEHSSGEEGLPRPKRVHYADEDSDQSTDTEDQQSTDTEEQEIADTQSTDTEEQEDMEEQLDSQQSSSSSDYVPSDDSFTSSIHVEGMPEAWLYPL